MPPPDIERIAARYEPRVARALLAAWDALAGQFTEGQILDAMRDGTEAVVSLLRSARLPDDLLQGMVAPLAEVMVAVSTPTAAQLNLVWSLPDERAASLVMRTADREGWLRWGIEPESREGIRRILQTAFREGGHPYETARAIKGLIGLDARREGALLNYAQGLLDQGVTGQAYERAMARRRALYLRQRAETIARTETLRAAKEGQREAWGEAVSQDLLDPEATRRVWILSSGACALCVENQQAGPIAFDAEWPNGLHPHPNCRCSEGLTFVD